LRFCKTNTVIDESNVINGNGNLTDQRETPVEYIARYLGIFGDI
jgi:hypothetical protein